MGALATKERLEIRGPSHLFEPAGSTLEDIVLSAWEDLGLKKVAECPVCGGALPAAGCDRCGSQLS